MTLLATVACARLEGNPAVIAMMRECKEFWILAPVKVIGLLTAA